MKRLFLIGFFAVFCGFFNNAAAQTTEAFRRGLQVPDSTLRTTVTVTEHGDAAAAVRAMQSYPGNAEIDVIRVLILSDNSQTGRDKALAAEKQFKELYPGIPTEMKYENPYFKVYVGYCLTLEEAIVLEEKVKPTFPRAHRVYVKAPIVVFTE